MLSSLPNFWKIAKSFMDGKYKKVDFAYSSQAIIKTNNLRQTTPATGTRRSPTQCRAMTVDIVKLYISLLSEFFSLSDVVVMSSPGGSNNALPPLIPTDSSSLATVQYLMKILGEVQDSVNELNGMDISNDVSSGLKSLLESTRWRFEDILTRVWIRGQYI
jgi:exocyst complex component 2